MESKDVNFKKFIADEGMALKWKIKSWDYQKNEVVEGYCWSPYEALIDINTLVGQVEEIPYEQYVEEAKICAFGTPFN